ncbi:MAG: hypothetical protein CMJ78_07795 [Planctomycetaceae bacterium]|nr:hypothetical protein [Planctomycetaceae bacterium]
MPIGNLPAFDPDGDPIFYAGASGSFFVDYNGDVVYPGFDLLSPGDSILFTATVADFAGNSDTATVSINIQAAGNLPPSFVQDEYVFNVPADLAPFADIGDALAIDPEGDSLNYSASAAPFSVDYDGSIVYSGADSLAAGDQHTFTVTVSDNFGSDTAQVIVQVFESNSPPVFDQDSYAFSVSSSVAADTVLGRLVATDADGDSLLYSGGSIPFYVDGSGFLRFAGPQGSITPGDSYAFDASVDDQTATDSTAVSINVVGEDVPIDAIDDYFSGDIGTAIPVDVLANDLGSGLSVDSAASDVGNVTLVDVDGDGYTDLIELLVNDSSVSEAQIQYSAKDAAGNIDFAVAFVALQVANGNVPPRFIKSPDGEPENLADEQIYSFDYFVGSKSAGRVFVYDPMDPAQPVPGNPGETETDAKLTFELSGDDFTIILERRYQSDRYIAKVVPTRRFTLTDLATLEQQMLSARVTDEAGAFDTAQVWISFKNPVKAVNDSIQLTRSQNATFVESPLTVLGNDKAGWGRFAIELRQQASNGSIEFNSQHLGFFKYTPNNAANFPGNDSFVYRLRDLTTGYVSNDATVSLSFVLQQPPMVLARGDIRTATITPNATEYLFNQASDSVLGNDIPATGVVPIVVSQARYGEIDLNPDGTFKYTVRANNPLRGAITDTFSYSIMNGGMSVGVVSIRFAEPTPTVTNPVLQQPPRFIKPYYVFTYQELQNNQANLSATDADGDPLTFGIETFPQSGWVTATDLGGGNVRLKRDILQAPPDDGVYQVRVTVKDGQNAPNGQPQIDKAIVFIVVSSNSAQNPVFVATPTAGGPNPYTVSVDANDLANANGWFATGKLVKADDPAGEAVAYSIVAPHGDPNYSSPVRVNELTGEILVSGNLWESPTLEVDVLAQDADGHMALTKLQVTVANIGNYTAKLFVQGQGDAEDVAGNDVAQGTLGNCWFLAALGALADTSPQVIRSMVQEQNGQYFVRFYTRQNDMAPLAPVWIPVSFELAGGAGADVDSQNNVEVWVRVIERAYIQFVGGASNVTGGYPSTAFELITGYPAIPGNTIGSNTANQIQAALNNGRIVWIATLDEPQLPAGLVPLHAYEVTGIYTDQFNVKHAQLRNPHGTNNVTIELEVLMTAISAWWTT